MANRGDARQRQEGEQARERTREEAPRDDREPARSGGDIPFWEWVVAGLGAVLVIGSIGFMLYEAVAGDDSPPDVVIRVDSVLPVQGGYLVRIRARNQGGTTAAGLTVEGELKGDTGAIETSETTVDFLPPNSERFGGLFFTRDPRRHTLELRAKGYQDP